MTSQRRPDKGAKPEAGKKAVRKKPAPATKLAATNLSRPAPKSEVEPASKPVKAKHSPFKETTTSSKPATKSVGSGVKRLAAAAARKKPEPSVKVEPGKGTKTSGATAGKSGAEQPPTPPAKDSDRKKPTAAAPTTITQPMAAKPVESASGPVAPARPAKKKKTASPVSKSTARKAGPTQRRPAFKAAKETIAREPARALVELPAMAQPAKKKLTLKIPALLLEGDQSPGQHPGGPGTRYALGLSATPGEDAGDELVLPESYGTRKLWLVPRDPQWLYAHWDLDNSQLREYNQLSRDGHLILRVHDAAAPTEAIAEIHVHPESRSWFAHVGKGGGQYFAVLGFRDKTGEWNEVSRSNPVGTPPDSLSDELEAEFSTIPGTVKFTELIEAIREYVAGEPTPLVRAIEQLRESGHPDLPLRFELPPRSEFAHWTPAQQEALARVISMDEVRQVWAGSQPSSIAAARLVSEKWQRELASIAAIPAGELSAASVGGARAISSPHGAPPAEHAFWFNVNAELVVYGATEPNATVSIGGRAIRLRRDGTFSYRFALPDGEYQLPITAESADGFEARHASLHFVRGTEYHGDVGAHPQDASLQTPVPEHTA